MHRVQQPAIGFHVYKGKHKTYYDAFASALALLRSYLPNVRPAMQVFVSGPQTRGINFSANDIAAVSHATCPRAYANANAHADSPLLFIHGAYVDNPWGKTITSVQNIADELAVAAQLRAQGVIVHMSKNTTVALPWVIEQLAKRVEAAAPTIYLEINAAKPSADTFETPEKINALFAQVRLSLRAVTRSANLRVGLCIDTAHLWACGVDLREYADASNWLAGLDRALISECAGGADANAHSPPIIIHLNDSKSARGSGKDQHAGLFRGNIWGNGHPNEVARAAADIAREDTGCAAVLEFAIDNAIPCILERDADGLVQDLIALQQFGYY